MAGCEGKIHVTPNLCNKCDEPPSRCDCELMKLFP